MYAATKGFVTNFVQAIGYENFGQYPEMTCYCPASIQTNMTDKFSKLDRKFSEQDLFISPTTAVFSHFNEIARPWSRYFGFLSQGHWSHVLNYGPITAMRFVFPEIMH